MNSNILIYCDFLTKEDVYQYTKIPFVDEDMYQGSFANTGDFKLLGVHFPFDIIGGMIWGLLVSLLIYKLYLIKQNATI